MNYPRPRKNKKQNQIGEAALEGQGAYVSPIAGAQKKAGLIPLLEQLPPGERPADRLLEGRRSLSLTELIAIQIGGKSQIEIAQQIVNDCGRDLRKLRPDHLTRIHGIGREKSCRLVSAVELGMRMAKYEKEESLTILSTAAAAALLQYEMAGLEQESFRTILLDARMRLIKVHEVYIGSLTTAVIRTGEVFREAIRANAANMIVAHNHPSSDPNPSPEDVAVTRNLIEAGRLLDITVLDHLVIGGHRFVSMREHGLMQFNNTGRKE